MAHTHAHSHSHAHGHASAGRDRTGERGRLKIVLAITGLFMLVEVVGGLLSNSLALLADAGHMFADVGALALSMVAIRLAQRPPSVRKTYGYVRLEILSPSTDNLA